MYLKSTKDRLYKLTPNLCRTYVESSAILPDLNNKVDLNRMSSLNSRTYAELTSFFDLFELDAT